MTLPLSGKIALVTGASSGIGAATVRALSAAGAKIVAAARRTDRLDALAREAKDVVPLAIDLLDPAQAQTAVAQTIERFGKIDILINNAGVMYLSPVADADLDKWRDMIELNLVSIIATTKAAFADMTKRKDGHVVNISSVAGRSSGPTSAAYSATKFGMNGFSEGFRREALKQNVRVTVIEPGAVATELRDHIPDPKLRDSVNSWAESLRQLQSEDVANAVLYAVSQPPHVNIAEIMMRSTDQDL